MRTRQYLEEEIEKLRIELSTTIPQEIQEALHLGDLRENSEYSSAIARQDLANARLEQLINRLNIHKEIDYSQLPDDAVNIGSLVKLRCLSTQKILYVKMVIDDIEENDDYQEITINSPMGTALKNKKVKDEVFVKSPNGTNKYRILQIKTIHNFS